MREEEQIDADKGRPEVQFAPQLAVLVSGHFAEPVIPARKDSEHGSQRQDVMEVRDDVIGVVERPVDARVCEHDSGHAADGKHENEPDGEQHGRVKPQRTAPHRRDPGEDFYARGNGDHHGRDDEIRLHVRGHPDRVHVMRPDKESDDPDQHHRINHSEIAEDGLARERRDNLRDDAERRQNHDVDLRMPEEPEEMLEEDGIAASGRIEKGRAEVSIGQEHRDCAGKHGDCEQQQERRYQYRPGEEGHLVQRHSGRAHIEDGCDEINGAKHRGGSRQMQREDCHIHRRAGMRGRGERRIDGPAGPDTVAGSASLNEHGAQQQQERGRQQPERNVVHARECHIGRADHERDEPVAEAPDERGHHHEENHNQAVRGDNDVVKVVISAEDLVSGRHELHAHNDGEHPADDSGEDGKDEVHGADVFVVCGVGETPPARDMRFGSAHDASSVAGVIPACSCCCATHSLNLLCETTWISMGMNACRTPQSSEHWP